MVDKNDDANPMEELQKHLSELFGKGGVNFSAFPGFQQETEEDEDEAEAAEERNETLERVREFELKPREVKDYLDRFVIKQDEAKKVISVAICDHYNHVRRCLEDPAVAEQPYAKQNVILLGPTGVGKTYIMRTLARLIGVPFVKADATKFSETGYVGFDVDDIVRDLVKVADGDVELAQYGIVYIDEIDKIASQTTHGSKDASGRGVQINLLKLMEETDVTLTSQTDMIGQMQAMMEMQRTGAARRNTINTQHMLFIVSGAFMPMTELIRQRLSTTNIGFGSEDAKALDEVDCLKRVETQDFIKFGFEPEFIGRLPVRVALENLDAEDLKEILLNSEGSILQQYVEDFRGYDIEVNFADEALTVVAQQAAQEKTGARGLMTVLERSLRDFKFELPSTTIRQLDLDAGAIDEPDARLHALLQEHGSEEQALLREEVAAFAQRFEEQYGIELDFLPDGIDALVALCRETGKTIRGLCDERFRDFQYGLKLVEQKSGRKRFAIDAAVVQQPDQALSEWVLESCGKRT